MWKKYGNKPHLLLTDTHSLMNHVERADLYKDMVESKELDDLTNFKSTTPFYQPDFTRNKAFPGKRQDETGGTPSWSVVVYVQRCTPSKRCTSAQMEVG